MKKLECKVIYNGNLLIVLNEELKKENIKSLNLKRKNFILIDNNNNKYKIDNNIEKIDRVFVLNEEDYNGSKLNAEALIFENN